MRANVSPRTIPPDPTFDALPFGGDDTAETRAFAEARRAEWPACRPLNRLVADASVEVPDHE